MNKSLGDLNVGDIYYGKSFINEITVKEKHFMKGKCLIDFNPRLRNIEFEVNTNYVKFNIATPAVIYLLKKCV